MWPISWRKPELTAVTAATAAAEAVTVEEEQQMHAWMDRAYDLAEANKSSGHICNAAVVVDPATGQKSMYCKFHVRVGHGSSQPVSMSYASCFVLLEVSALHM